MSNKLGAEAAVQSRLALLLPHQEKRLPEAVILVAFLAQSRARDLVRVGDARGDGLRGGPGEHELDEVAGRLALVWSLLAQVNLKRNNLSVCRQLMQQVGLTSFFFNAS